MKILRLRPIIKNIFVNYGLSKKDSKICVNALINAELVGSHSYGLSRLKMYHDQISKNLIKPNLKRTNFKKLKYKDYYTDRESLMNIISVEKLLDEIV
tara:strand:+ start:57 stop:350 length:294 start_codon:yes stop_codon:yes gene_type:complete